LIYCRSDQTATHEPHAALGIFACGSLELSEKLYACSLFFIFIAKCRNIVKWYWGSWCAVRRLQVVPKRIMISQACIANKFVFSDFMLQLFITSVLCGSYIVMRLIYQAGLANPDLLFHMTQLINKKYTKSHHAKK